MVLQQTEIEGKLLDTTLAVIEKSIERIVESKATNAMEKLNETINTNVEKSHVHR